MKYLLIDTSIYEAEGFDFKQGYLKVVVELCKKEEIKLLIHKIIKHEVSDHIQKKAEEYYKYINHANRLSPIFEENVLINELKSIDKKMIDKIALNSFEHFLNETKVEEIGNDKIDINKIIDDYCDVKAPFGTGEKKFEFPDAFVLNALSSYCFKQEDIVYVIANDMDWYRYFKGNDTFKYYTDFYQLMRDLVSAKELVFTERLQLWCKNLTKRKQLIQMLNQELIKQFDHLDFDFDDIFDNDSEIEEIFNPECIYINPENMKISFQINFKAAIEFAAGFYDYDNAYYDKEDDEYYNVEYIRRVYGDVFPGVAIVGLQYFVDKNNHIQFKSYDEIEVFQFDNGYKIEKANFQDMEVDILEEIIDF